MNDNQLHNLYTFLTRKFDTIDARFNAIDERFEIIDRKFDEVDARFDKIDIRLEGIDARFDENETIQNEILNAIGTNLAEHHTTLRNHSKRIVKLERRTASP
tara:strand:- start:83 stop:388 length:306 start_codon:yes stop_codon:yes gene_type:complete